MAHAHRRGMLRIDERSLRGGNRNVSQEACIQRHGRIERADESQNAQRQPGMRLAVARDVHGRSDLRIGSGEVEMYRPIAEGHCQRETYGQVGNSIVVEKIRKAIGAVRDLAQDASAPSRPRSRADPVGRPGRLSTPCCAISVLDPPAAGSQRRQHRADIAHIGVGRTRIGGEEELHVVIDLARCGRASSGGICRPS